MAWDYLNNGEAHKASPILQEIGDEPTLKPAEIRQMVLTAYALYVGGELKRANDLFDQALMTMQSMHRIRGLGYGTWDVFTHAVRGEKQKAISALRDYWWRLQYPVYDFMREEPEWIKPVNEIDADIADQRRWFEEHKNDPLF